MVRQFRRIDAKVWFLAVGLILVVAIPFLAFTTEWHQQLSLTANLATALITFMAILFAGDVPTSSSTIRP